MAILQAQQRATSARLNTIERSLSIMCDTQMEIMAILKPDLPDEVMDDDSNEQRWGDIITYNTLIDGFYKAGRRYEAEKLFSEMRGCGQLPDVQTEAVILDGLCNNQQLFRALELLREMEGKKLELNIVVYNIIIEGLCKAGKMGRAMRFFSGLSSKHLLIF